MRRRAQITIASTALIILFFILRLSHPARPLVQQSRALKEAESGSLSTSQDQKPLNAVATTVSAQRDSGPSYIFAFGDSYTTYGFESDGTPPSISNPLGNRVQTDKNTTQVQLVTSTPKWLDFLINDYSPPDTLAYNYGRGASTIDDDVIAPHFWGAKSLVNQGKEFFLTADNEKSPMHANWTGANSAFVVWFGINDVANTAEEKELDRDGLYLRAVQSYLRVLQGLYGAGARRFLLLSLPPIDHTPQLLLMGPPHTFDITTASQMFTELLEQHLDVWIAQKAVKAKFFDIQPTFHRVLNANPIDATCTVVEKETCLWVDMFHPAEKLQKAVGEQISETLRDLGMWR